MPDTMPPIVTLHEADASDLGCIENMMQFYNYELSQWHPIEFESSGLYGIRSKAEYWAKPQVRPYLIRVNENLAGFAVVDDEIVHPQSTHNLGYFFVARRYRGHGIGSTAFLALLQRFPGAWEVYHLAKNEAAARFWPMVFAKEGAVNVSVSNEVIHDEPSVLYRFTVHSAI